MKRYEITFIYHDEYCRDGKWNEQRCELSAHSEYEAIKECIEIYDLGYDCEYKIESVKEIDND